MNLTSVLDYVIAITGILIIIISFVWNIYEVFVHKTGRHPNGRENHSEDSAIR